MGDRERVLGSVSVSAVSGHLTLRYQSTGGRLGGAAERSRMTRIERSEISSSLLRCQLAMSTMWGDSAGPTAWYTDTLIQHRSQQFPWPGDTSVVSCCSQHRQHREIGPLRLNNIPNFKIKYFKVNRMRILTGSVYLGEDLEVPPKCNPAESETLDSGTGTLAWIFCKYFTLETLCLLYIFLAPVCGQSQQHLALAGSDKLAWGGASALQQIREQIAWLFTATVIYCTFIPVCLLWKG